VGERWLKSEDVLARVDELSGNVVGLAAKEKDGQQVGVFFLLTPFHKTMACSGRGDSILCMVFPAT
jgi:hypothetical protein